MRQLLSQIGKFAAVGLIATGLHVATALILNHFAGMSTLRANFAAFIVSVAFNFLANWAWTFSGLGQLRSSAMKFLVMSLGSFGFNQAIVYWLTVHLTYPLWVAMMAVVAVIPPLNFILSRSFVFRQERKRLA